VVAIARKRYKPEEIVAKLRQVHVLVSQGQAIGVRDRRIEVSEVTYCGHRERPRSRSPTEQRDELAPLYLRAHSITSSARASKVEGTSMPSAFAVFRLMTRS
jgi:hypothetical protein